MTEDNARQGRRNQSAGKRWQQDCAAWLRANGWPGAGYEIRNRSSDLIGTWDLAVECTITGWDKIWIKLQQAGKDAFVRGLSDFCVWKKHNGVADPGGGAVVLPAHVFFPLVQRLEKLEAEALRADDEFTRGFTAGVIYARKHPGPVEAEEAV